MIYRLPPLDAPIDQGDIVSNCPIGFVVGCHLDQRDAVELGCERRRALVLTQTCDLVNDKTSLVTVAVTHDARSLVERGLLKPGDIRGAVRAGRVFGWYFLPASQEHGLPETIVDFRQVFSMPRDLVSALCRNGHRCARLQVPFREHLARHFAETYARIGLPEPYPTELNAHDS
jgi:hypothetical protein